jgi:hypothetical protein
VEWRRWLAARRSSPAAIPSTCPASPRAVCPAGTAPSACARTAARSTHSSRAGRCAGLCRCAPAP